MSPLARRSRRRLVWSGTVAAAVVASALTIPTSGAGSGTTSVAEANEARKASLGLPHQDPPGTPPHTHNDPATKNLISRAGEVGRNAQDPTTAAERLAASAYVAAERARPDPKLRKAPLPTRTKVPRTRYAMANGCYSLAGQPIYFKPTTLGVYLLFDKRRQFVTAGGRAAAPSPRTEWTARKIGTKFSFTNGGKKLRIRGADRFALRGTKGCARYPESAINIHGAPFAGVTPYQEVRGYVDGHTHGMAFEFLGGRVHCGKPWDKYGAPYALQDCADHTSTAGYGAILETFFSGESRARPGRLADVQGLAGPELADPRGHLLPLARAGLAGRAAVVRQPARREQQAVPDLPAEAELLRRHGLDPAAGPGHVQDAGLHRRPGRWPGQGLLPDRQGPVRGAPRDQRREDGRGHGHRDQRAVRLHDQVRPTGLLRQGDQPAAQRGAQARRASDGARQQVRQRPVRRCRRPGRDRLVVNGANFLETGSFWDMRHCEPDDGESHDNNQVALPDISAGQQDALFGAIGQLFGALGSAVLPLYPTPDHCNNRGLTDLGEFTVRGLAKRKMIFDPDHMSVKGRRSAMNLIEKMDYPGVISSHSWATPDAYPRVYKAGGFITPYAGDSTGFVKKWREHIGWADKRYYWGIGFGADINGLGAQGDPRGKNVRNKVAYPFRGFGGVRIDKQHAGKRVYDINADGVAQYGLYPDWVEDLSKVAGKDGSKIADDMARGAEAYLQMWERAEGIEADSCRNPKLRKPLATVHRLVRPGMSTFAVMRAVGQPFSRLGSSYGICATRGSKQRPGHDPLRGKRQGDRSYPSVGFFSREHGTGAPAAGP